jgi:hypothetical protein
MAIAVLFAAGVAPGSGRRRLRGDGASLDNRWGVRLEVGRFFLAREEGPSGLCPGGMECIGSPGGRVPITHYCSTHSNVPEGRASGFDWQRCKS